MPGRDHGGASHALLALVTFALTAANVAAITVPFEIYPFTSAPMFAHPPVGSGTRYVVDLTLLTGGSVEREFPYRAIGFTETHFTRTLLVQGYGSVDADAPYGYVRDDDDAARARRLTAFFRACADALRERDAMPAGVTGIRLSLRKSSGEAWTREIGTYDLVASEFRRPGDPR